MSVINLTFCFSSLFIFNNNYLPDNKDENLAKSWNALKNGKIIQIQQAEGQLYDTFLCLSKEISYLLCNDNEDQFLLIRSCYHDLSNIILNSKETNCRITTNPGIGKTFFGYYLLYKLAQQNKTVVYHKTNKCAILFCGKSAFYCKEIFHYLHDRTVWYIVDDRKPIICDAKTILISSPQYHYYKQIDKHGVRIMYMPGRNRCMQTCDF